ncbi:MAG: hypothetical protein O3A62_02850 [Actinomycetota bacterium]|nr:hypothetical protein [Actinomycetota bacterium]
MSTSKEQILIDRRYAAVLATISDDSLAQMAMSLPEKLRDPFAKVAGLPAGALSTKDGLGAKIRAGFTSRKSFINVGVLLSEPCTEYCIEQLGTAADDPNVEHLKTTLPGAIEKFGLDATRLMAIQYSVSLNGFKQLVATDERFMVPKTESAQVTPTVAPTTKASNEDLEKRRLRRERQEKEREEKRQADLQRRIARNRV